MHRSYQSLEPSSTPSWHEIITRAMANKLAKIMIAAPLPLQAWNQLWWAPSLEPQIYTLPPTSAGVKSTGMDPSTGGPNQHIGPLPLQARKQLWWAPAHSKCDLLSSVYPKTLLLPTERGNGLQYGCVTAVVQQLVVCQEVDIWDKCLCFVVNENQKQNSSGPSKLPWGTPLVMLHWSDISAMSTNSCSIFLGRVVQFILPKL